MAGPLKAHQTTIRFTHEQWDALQLAAAARQVSVAQYVRDAARERLEVDARTGSDQTQQQTVRAGMEYATERSLGIAEGTAALWEQGRLARERARTLRGLSREQRLNHGKHRDQRGDRSESTAALWEKGRLARERARLLREEVREETRRGADLARLGRDAAAVEDTRGVVRGPVQQDRVIRGT
jgi:hypothetical protein